jgi:four helix bundle protein
MISWPPCSPIRSFTQLNAWRACRELSLSLNQLLNAFPPFERFELTSQLRRAGTSATSNLAEGFGKQSYKEKLHYYSCSLGSINEIQNQLIVAKDAGYVSVEHFNAVFMISITASKITNGLIKKTKEIIRNS